MRRWIDKELLDWKRFQERKPLLLRGARQVGKTFSIRHLGGTFSYFAEINFEEIPEARRLFQGRLSVQPLCEKLSALTRMPIRPGETLLLFDEVQSCPEVLASLRYFHEQMPDLHVVAAGSLLEFALDQIPSLGVGRLTSCFMYPLTFAEFLDALGEARLMECVNHATFEQPLEEVFHKRLVDYFRTFLWVGGMPEAVMNYVRHHDIHHVMRVLDDLILTLQDDFSKYRKRTPAARLWETFQSAAMQTGGKFVCATVNPSVKSTAILSAFDLLKKSGLVHQVFRCGAQGLPLGATVDGRHFKALLLDVGIHQRLLGLDVSSSLLASEIELVNKGSTAELFVALQIIALHPSNRRPELYYWQRENRGAQAEVDYVIQHQERIIPLEVKAGTRGGMQSLRMFLAGQKKYTRGVRLSLENFGRLEDADILPLYAVHRLFDGSLSIGASVGSTPKTENNTGRNTAKPRF